MRLAGHGQDISQGMYFDAANGLCQRETLREKTTEEIRASYCKQLVPSQVHL